MAEYKASEKKLTKEAEELRMKEAEKAAKIIAREIAEHHAAIKAGEAAIAPDPDALTKATEAVKKAREESAAKPKDADATKALEKAQLTLGKLKVAGVSAAAVPPAVVVPETSAIKIDPQAPNETPAYRLNVGNGHVIVKGVTPDQGHFKDKSILSVQINIAGQKGVGVAGELNIEGEFTGVLKHTVAGKLDGDGKKPLLLDKRELPKEVVPYVEIVKGAVGKKTDLGKSIDNPQTEPAKLEKRVDAGKLLKFNPVA